MKYPLFKSGHFRTDDYVLKKEGIKDDRRGTAEAEGMEHTSDGV